MCFRFIALSHNPTERHVIYHCWSKVLERIIGDVKLVLSSYQSAMLTFALRFSVLTICAACFLASATSILAECSVTEDTVIIDGVSFSRNDAITAVGKYSRGGMEEMWYTKGKAVLRVVMINGKANQDALDFHLLPGAWELDSSKFEQDEWFEATGQWRDVRLSVTSKVMTFQVTFLKPVKAVSLRFGHFEDRAAVFTGIAMKGGLFRCDGEQARIEGLGEWPESAIGNEVNVRGILNRSGDSWQFSAASWRLDKLADQIGRQVTLDGVLWSAGGGRTWWFEYRGERVYLTLEKGPSLTFESNRHATAARIKGLLVRQLRPMSGKMVMQFVIRGAHVEFLEPPLKWEDRLRTVYAHPVLIEDGVPMLVPETSFRISVSESDTNAKLYKERNNHAIKSILRTPTPAQVEVMAKRMDATRESSLRLIYAAMLAACNDTRGRVALLASVKNHATVSPDSLYCLGAFPYLPPKDTTLKPDTAWAEEAMIGLLKDPATARDCAVYSNVIEVLLQRKSNQATAAVVKFALSSAPGSSMAVDWLCESETPLTLELLTQLAGSPTVDQPNLRVLRKMLKQHEPDAVKLYGKLLAVSDVYDEFREAMSPAMVEALRAELDNLNDESLTYAKMLIAGQTPNAVEEWIKLLEDRKWSDKNVVTWELAQLKDSRSLLPIARCLRQAKDGYFRTESEFIPATPITHCLDAIAGMGGDDATEELIKLMSVEFGRAKGNYPDDSDLHFYAAVALIELTGESFGMDASAWSRWGAARKAGQ